ncbi:MAG TPA: polysaccharide biosynthesis C-terminal domain-containing protein [Polyangia bacterium]|nr:polysaccharide biosynthesis C-terminal domain-containing protein [Polyangia bacterium]
MAANGQEAPEAYSGAIVKGAVVNAMGIAGKAIVPVFFIIAAKLYGASAMGLFYLAYTMITVAESLVSAGFNSGTVMYASRYLDDPSKEHELYRILSNSFAISLGVSLLLILFTRVGGAQLILAHYPQENLLSAVQRMTLALPFIVTSTVVVAATKAHLTMKWDAIFFGFTRPILLTVFALFFYLFEMGLEGLIIGYLMTEVTICAAALVVFGRYFSYGKLFGQIFRFRFSSALLWFAIPQSLNTTFNTFITNVDVIMLGYFGVDERMLWAYGMGSQVVRNIRQVKLALSGSFAPVVAKLHGKGDMDGMSESFSMVTRWITSIGLPLALVVVVLRLDLLRLFDSTYDGETLFMLLLLAPPLLSCCCGLAGNIIVMTGHSGWNLFNSATVALVNVGLNLLLIPRFGIIGAAVATVIASVAISALQLVEAKKLLGVGLIPARIYKPYLAVALPVAGILVAHLVGPAMGSLASRIAVAAVAVALFFVGLLVLKVDERDRRILFPWLSGGAGKGGGGA